MSDSLDTLEQLHALIKFSLPKYIEVRKERNFNFFIKKKYFTEFPEPFDKFYNGRYSIGVQYSGMLIKEYRLYFNQIDLTKFAIWYNLR